MYGLKTRIFLRKTTELVTFENDLIELVKNAKLRKIRNQFQKRLQQDNKTLKTSNKTVTFADKTNNIYEFTKEQYDKLLKN